MRLDNGDQFPRIVASLVSGATVTLPDDLENEWSVLLFYRGHW